MTDLLYVLVTTAFFAAMHAYVTACDRLGRRGPDAPPS